jgi:acyl carrier protein
VATEEHPVVFISSRTPEGRPNHCPVCGSDVCLEPSLLTGDAPCPACGHLLWFVNLPKQSLVFEHRSSSKIRDRVVEIIARELGVSPDEVKSVQFVNNDSPSDSLDLVELAMELEEEFELS